MRTRLIKPGFFKNEDLLEISFEGRLLFIGLWTMADREGRLEDRPKKIKMELFPCDNIDIDKLIEELSEKKFVKRYEVLGQNIIQVTNFLKHQKPHARELPSLLPSFEDKTQPRPDPDTTQAGPSNDLGNGRVALDPLTLNLDPLTLNLDPVHSTDGDVSSLLKKYHETPVCPHKEIIEAYHRILPELPRVIQWTDARKAFLQLRWREDTERQSLDWWQMFFRQVSKSDFLMGRVDCKDQESFQANLEWLIRPSNFVKVLEGNYNNRKEEPPPVDPDAPQKKLNKVEMEAFLEKCRRGELA